MAAHRAPRWGHPIITVALTLLVLTVVLAVASRFAPWEIPAGDIIIRSQPERTHPFPPPDAASLLTASRRHEVVVNDEIRPRNVILVIGDGMGIGQISTASPASAIRIPTIQPGRGRFRSHVAAIRPVMPSM